MTAYSTYNDKELWGYTRKENEQAFTELYNRYWKLLFYIAQQKLQSFEAAEEIVQEIFTDLWARKDSIELKRSLKYYLASAVKYQVIKHLAQRKQSLSEELYADTPALSDSYLTFRELQEQLEALVADLPEKCRLVYQLSRDEGLSHKDIADKLNISEKTVENHLTKALSRLRKGLGDAAFMYLHFTLGIAGIAGTTRNFD